MPKNIHSSSSKVALEELLNAILNLENHDKAERFFKDLCTPQELAALAERWRVCTLLHTQKLSYREIHDATGASLATITRVARFLKTEPHQGYAHLLKKIACAKKHQKPKESM